MFFPDLISSIYSFLFAVVFRMRSITLSLPITGSKSLISSFFTAALGKVICPLPFCYNVYRKSFCAHSFTK